MNIQILYTSSDNNGRLPEEPNGSMNWPPIMKIKILQLTIININIAYFSNVVRDAVDAPSKSSALFFPEICHVL